MSTHKKLITVAAVATLAFGFAACGDNDNGPSTMMDDMPAMDLAWDMLDGETVEPGTYAISSAPADLLDDAADIVVPEGGFVPGSMVELGGYVLTCSGTVNCSVTVDDEDNVMTTGTIMVMAKMDPTVPDPTVPDPTVPDPTVPMADAVTLPADLPETLPAAEGEIMIAAGMSEDSGGVMFSCAADGEACVVTVDADGMATSTGGTVTATLTMAAQEVADEAVTKMAMEMRDRGIGQSAALSNPGTAPTITSISHPAGKSTSVRVTGFTPAENQPAKLGNFDGVALTNTSSAASTQHMVVYTDIAAPTKVQFYNYDGSDETLHVYDGEPGTALTLTSGDGGIFSAANLDLMIFPTKAATASGGDTVKRFAANRRADGVTEGAPTIVRLPGTFDGANGLYMCTAADGYCTVTVSASGMYTPAQPWTFTPNNGEMAYREDTEVLSFGWWLTEPAKSTGSYSFDAFQMGAGYTATDAGTGVSGSATYTGNAAGRYVMSDEGGSFTADAELTAKFGSDSQDGSVSGMIDNFSGDAAGMSGWKVELKQIDIGTGGLAAAFASDTDVTDPTSSSYDGTVATLGSVTAHGIWGGQFHGNERNAAADGGGPKMNAAPLAVGGTFDANAAGANIAGAFGARR